MIPGPDQIVACPHCGGLAKYLTLVSGNTFRARVWTDGKQVAPMLPRPPAIVKCRHCAECYWLADAREVGTIEPWGSGEEIIDPAWTAAQEVEEPSEDEYYRAIEKGLARNVEQERNARIFAWWRRNDAFRELAPTRCETTVPAASKRNLEDLTTLLQESDENDCVMKAEVLRELGDFEFAKRVLSRVTSAEFNAVVRQLRTLCDSGDTCVRQLIFSG
jgi:hypothetical protein